MFGAVFALLLGQALSLRESVAMQDLLSTRTLSRIGHMIAFIFIGTIIIEAVGAVSIFGMVTYTSSGTTVSFIRLALFAMPVLVCSTTVSSTTIEAGVYMQ